MNFVIIPPPTPARPENIPIVAPARLRKVPVGGLSAIGVKRPREGKARRKDQAHKTENARHKTAAQMWCGELSGDDPGDYPGPHSRINPMSVFPARQCPIDDTTAAGRIAANDVPTAMWAA